MSWYLLPWSSYPTRHKTQTICRQQFTAVYCISCCKFHSFAIYIYDSCRISYQYVLNNIAERLHQVFIPWYRIISCAIPSSAPVNMFVYKYKMLGNFSIYSILGIRFYIIYRIAWYGFSFHKIFRCPWTETKSSKEISTLLNYLVCWQTPYA
jgi:hypothetical protein